MEVYWVWLCELEGLTPKGMLRVLSAFGSPEAAFHATERELDSRKGLKDEDRKALRCRDLTAAQKIVEDCYERNISILTMEDHRYPDLLRQIPDPPPVLYYVGRLPDFDHELTIAIVGHRKASAQGMEIACKLGYELSRAGVIVISGCAAGVDAAAMQGALRGGSSVVGILGGGVDVVYPKENRRLLEDVQDYGCLISEYPPGTKPLGWHFPIRNRIISGLSRGVIVAEAPKQSGSLITARLAIEQGRDVFAVPGAAGGRLCAGSNDLLRQGAALAENGSDVVDGYAYLFPERVRPLTEEDRASYEAIAAELRDNSPEVLVASPVKTPRSGGKIDIDNGKTPTYIDVQEAAAGLPPDEAAVLGTLSEGRLQTDEIIRRSGMTASAVLGILTMLEVRGLIRSLPGGIYSLREASGNP